MKHLLTAGVCCAAGLTAAAVPKTKPNIIFIYIDDMGYGDLDCNGGTYRATPNIDRLAAEGIRFEQFYVASPISSPSRVGATTGMYPTRWGINTFLNTRKANARNEQNDYLSAAAPSLARTLRENGYATGHFGKWHMGGGRDVTDAPSIGSYGFDEWVSTWESPDPDPLITATNWIWSAQDSVKRWDRTAYFVDKTIDFLRRNPGRPCYVNLWPDDVHAPWVPDAAVADEEKPVWMKQSSFRPVLARLDAEIGRLMRELTAMGLDENTIIVFSSDNGPEPSFAARRTGGFKGQKGSLYEGGIRVPLIVRWRGGIAPAQVDRKSVLCTVDLPSTLCALAGVPAPDEYPLDGMDCSAAFAGRPLAKRSVPLYWEYGKNLVVPNPVPFGNVYSPHLAMREGDWKLLANADGSSVELYRLSADPHEENNLAAENPKIAARMTQALLDWHRQSFRQYVQNK